MSDFDSFPNLLYFESASRLTKYSVSLPSEKTNIRSKLLETRENLEAAVADQMSGAILSNLRNLEPFVRAAVIHTYVSSKINEVDTKRLIADALIAGKRIVVPITNREHHRLDHSEILSLDELAPGTFGILEPAIRRAIGLDIVDVVIVPIVGVDRRGNRIGYGKGYYDRFLKLVDKPKVALAYAFQVIEQVPSDPEDVSVDFVVTEMEVIECAQ